MSVLRPLPRFLPLDPGLFPHRLDEIQRPTTAGTDASGVAVQAWATVYTDLPCLADLHEAGERGTGRGAGGGSAAGVFGQPVEEVRAVFYLAALPDGTLPDVRKRDRLRFGTWPGGEPRYVDVTGAFDPGQPNGLLLEIIGTARKPG